MRNSHGFCIQFGNKYKDGYYILIVSLQWLLRSKLDPYRFVAIVWIGNPAH